MQRWKHSVGFDAYVRHECHDVLRLNVVKESCAAVIKYGVRTSCDGAVYGIYDFIASTFRRAVSISMATTSTRFSGGVADFIQH